MLGKGEVIRTLFIQETGDKNIGEMVNDALSGNLSGYTILDIKYTAANDEAGYGWHSALIIYKFWD